MRALGLAIAGLFGFVALVLVVALVWINTERGEDWAATVAEEQLGSVLPGLQIGDIDGPLPFEVTIRDLSADELPGENRFRLDRLHLDLRLRSLLSQTIEVRKLEVDGLEAHLDPDNLPEMEESEPSGWSLVVGDIEVRDLDLVVHSGGERVAELRDLSLGGQLRSEPDRTYAEVRDLRVGYAAAGRSGTVGASLRASLDDERVDARLEARVSGVMGEEPLPIVASAAGPREQVAAALRVGEEQSPMVDARAELDLERPSYEASVEIDGFDPSALSSGLPGGQVRLALRASGEGAPLSEGSSLRASLSSPGFELGGQRVESIRAEARGQGRSWWLDELRLVAAGASASARGSGNLLETFEVAGSLDAPRFGPMDLAGAELEAQGRGRLEARRGEDGVVHLEGTTDLPLVSHGDNRITGFAAELAGQLDPERVSGQVSLEVGPFAANGARVRSIRATGSSDGRVLRVDGSFTPASRNGRPLQPALLHAELPIDQGPSGPEPAIAPDRPISASLEWSGVEIARLVELVGLEADLAGRLTIETVVRGTLERPTGSVKVLVANGRYEELRGISAGLELETSATATLATAVVSQRADELLRARAEARSGLLDLLRDDRWLHVPIELASEVPSLRPARLAPLVPALAELDGRVSLALEVDGSVADPSLSALARIVGRGPEGGAPVSGEARLTGGVEGGRTVLRGAASLNGERVSELSASLPFTPAGLAQGRPVNGRARARAELTVGPVPLETASALYPPLGRVAGQLAAELHLSGPLEAPTGRAELQLAGLELEGRPMGDLDLTARLTRRGGTLVGSLVQGDCAPTRLLATLGSDGAVEAAVSAERLDLGPVRAAWLDAPLADDILSLTLRARLTVDGPEPERGSAVPSPLQRILAASSFRGEVVVSDAALALYLARPGPEEPPAEVSVTGLAEQLRALPPARLRVEVRDSSIRLVDATVEGAPSVSVTELAATVENLATRRELMDGAPALLTLRGIVERSGEAVAFVSFDPLAEGPLAAGQAALRGLDLGSMNSFLRPYVEARATEGSLDVYAIFRLEGDRITGGVKPVVFSPELEPAPSGSWLRRIAIEGADLALDLVSDSVEDRDAIATVIPIRGSIDSVDVQIVPMVLGVIRNAFVLGLSASYDRLPLETAGEDRSIFAQAVEALSPERFVRAQPPES